MPRSRSSTTCSPPRIREVARWLPILSVDAHGMGAQDTHLFSPPREPINPNIPAHRRTWSDVFATDQAAAFDRHGLPYYCGEWNEEWYPGYSDGWASYRGAIGILYEQARIAADGVRRPEGRILSYRESVFHHVLGSLANLTTAANHSRKLLAALLQLQGFELHTLPAELAVPEATTQIGTVIPDLRLPVGTLLVPNRQPLGHLLSAFLEFDTRMPERAFFATRTDTNHWLTAGCPEPLPVLAGRGPVLMAGDGVEAPIRFGLLSPAPQAIEPPPATTTTTTTTPAKDTPADPATGAAGESSKAKEPKEAPRPGWSALPPATQMHLRMSGLVWPEATHRLANSAWVTRESLGRGQIILFASPPTFRAAARGTTRVFLNAVVLGPGLGATTALRP